MAAVREAVGARDRVRRGVRDRARAKDWDRGWGRAADRDRCRGQVQKAPAAEKGRVEKGQVPNEAQRRWKIAFSWERLADGFGCLHRKLRERLADWAGGCRILLKGHD